MRAAKVEEGEGGKLGKGWRVFVLRRTQGGHVEFLDKRSQRTRGFSAMTVERFRATISSGIAFTSEESAV